MDELIIDEHALKHGLEPEDIEYAWHNFVAKVYRGAPNEGEVIAVGYDGRGRFLEIGDGWCCKAVWDGHIPRHDAADAQRHERAWNGEELRMARVMTSKEIEAEFGIPAEQLGQWADDAERGVYHGEPRGEVVRGRPLLFGEETRQVGFKEPLGKVELIDRRAEQLGMKRSDYLRHLVDQDLKLAGIA